MGKFLMNRKIQNEQNIFTDSFANKVNIVTGGGTGIGFGVARGMISWIIRRRAYK